MSLQRWGELLGWEVADGTAVANTTTETVIYPARTVPANYMADGRVLSGYVKGKLSNTASATIIFAIRWGSAAAGTILAQSEAITPGAAVTNVLWSYRFDIQTRSNGATGTLLAVCDLWMSLTASTSFTQVFGVSGFDAPATATVDLTADTALSFTADWSAASASNTLTGMQFFLNSPN